MVDLTGVFARYCNSTNLVTSLPVRVQTQSLRIGPVELYAGDLLIAHAFHEVTTQETTLNAMLANRLIIAQSQSSTYPQRNADIIGGPSTQNDVINITPSMHHYTAKASGATVVASTGTYWLIHLLYWDGLYGLRPGIVETICGIDLIRVRAPITV